MIRVTLIFSYCFVMVVLCLLMPSCTKGSINGRADSLHQQQHSITELQADFRQFRQFLEESHPRLYRFTSKRTFDSLFIAHYQRIDHTMTTREFYSILIPLVARVGCGHTSLWSPDGYWEQAPQSMFPLRVHARDNQIFAIQSYNDNIPFKPGSRIVSINGKNADSLVFEMLQNIWSDGFILSKKYRRLNTVFPYLYALTYGFPEQYEIVFMEDGIEKLVIADPVARAMVDVYIDSLFRPGGARNPGLKLDLVDEKAAILTIGSFSYYDDNEGFNSFIDSSFMTVRDHSIQHLIIDLRGNDGGDPFCSSHLLTYLQREPVVYFRERYGKYARLNQPLPMADQPYNGKQYYLIDGICFSTTGHFTSLLKYYGLGIFVGEETGATFTCNDASHDMVLKNTGFRIQSARRSFTTAVYGLPLNQGILPDHQVRQTIEEVVSGHDAVMDYTLRLISAKQQDVF